ncbi:hypothetical protein, variant 2 [Cryptococcus neoformans var. grubii H99]|uniref:Uncharacterized protein n=1 Tax=Cryptococcus neoformans (strain H99 / ATCC 208821 / CBS 10515 / FGSC 9487) TaxID=235443 RepID=T2BPE1_CRYN9|nr:hypothetical protein, variant 2 [Cryptococcus neoformans var. grubii H99]AGV14581.1 hypothetical protein, variant 2 [Cryptococcus neoformans var. grubii H99]AUB26797.1 hypothetical protein CKF44_07755 [Cryptococcus neoformans var. grubii]|eukprot:XP_012051874.1 hypothetical protein, variant 2 [Cryptococcus neoformans var. grubii H99]
MKDSLRMQSRFDVTEEKLYRDIDDQHGLRTVPTRKFEGAKPQNNRLRSDILTPLAHRSPARTAQ